MMPAVSSCVEITAREQVKEFIFTLKFESEKFVTCSFSHEKTVHRWNTLRKHVHFIYVV